MPASYDAHITQVGELRIFARDAYAFAMQMEYHCKMLRSSADDARREGRRLQEMMRDKVRKLRDDLENAKQALSDYEHADHTDSEGRSTYDPSVAASLRRAVEEMERAYQLARQDLDRVECDYIELVHLVDTLQSQASSYASAISNAGSEVNRQVNAAAFIIESEYQS